jgi:predicted membrane protein
MTAGAPISRTHCRFPTKGRPGVKRLKRQGLINCGLVFVIVTVFSFLFLSREDVHHQHKRITKVIPRFGDE